MYISIFPLSVSIRSPHGCKGRFFSTFVGIEFFKFQSAPLTDVRGDGQKKEAAWGSLRSFNPLPSRM